MSNPFLQEFNTPFNTVPFNKIKLAHFKPAIEQAIKFGKAEIETIKKEKNPDFSNTIETLERSGSLLSTISSVFFNLNSAETSDEMQTLAKELSPILTAYHNEITMDEQLFSQIKTAHDKTNTDTLNPEQSTLLEKTYKSFVRNGALLKKAEKDELKTINTELSKLSLQFGENVLKESNLFELWIDKKEELSGLPEDICEAAKIAAESKGKENCYLFTLDFPSYIPFMKYADNRALREKIYMAYSSRAFQNNEFNNEDIVKQIVSLRHKKSLMLGYKSHADYTLEERMAKKDENVYALLDELLKHAKPVAIKEINEIQNICNRLNGPKKVERWDFSYYAEKLKTEKFDINDEILKPYFELDNVIDGAFKTANILYGINFELKDDIDRYHKDVKVYEVKDRNSKHLAVFYADFFPREGKRNGAWMTSYTGQNKYDETEQRPHISIVCNFSKPTTSKPSLLTFNEVTTLFHEFGHALHGILANGHYESLSGTSVYWDFVELPSQIMENWCYEKECLDLFAHHYETGEKIPMDLVGKIKDSANFLSGYQSVRQVSFGKLDMAWHNLLEAPTKGVGEFEQEAMKETELFPSIENTNMSCAFSHIFQGGYSAGYYSYKWAEILEADAYKFFIENGIFNQEIAKKFKDNILSRGGSEHPMELYIRFRGKKPSVKALLLKSGLI